MRTSDIFQATLTGTHRPRPLELTAADELVAIENMHMLQQNGFELAVDETAAVGQGSKLKVTAFPVSKSTEFGMAGKHRSFSG